MRKTKESPTIATSSKIWLIINILLTLYCILALSYGFYGIIRFGLTDSNFMKDLLIGTVIALVKPIAIIFSTDNFLDLFIISIIGFMLYVNAIYAIRFYIKERHQHPDYAIANLILACIPPLFCTIIFILGEFVV